MLISVHIPKTAGTSFGALLTRHFGDRLRKDYGDRPLSRPPLPRLMNALLQIQGMNARLREVDAVHGHFLPLKYRAVRGDVVTWLREPAQRMVSRYEHYRRDVTEGRPLQDIAGLRPAMTLEEFIEIPRFHNSYCKYFRGFPLRQVRCFGFSEDMAEGLARMQRTLGLTLGSVVQVNANPSRDNVLYDIPATIERRIRVLNAGDYRLWQWARDREGV